MIKIENVDVSGWEAAIRGMRNSYNSWDKSDSHWEFNEETCEHIYEVGRDDLELMKRLAKAGSDHGKFMRYLIVTADVLAPLYWWKEYSTYKVGTVANACSTMHKLHSRDLCLDDFSHEALSGWAEDALRETISVINLARDSFVKTNNKTDWKVMIQLLPESYNQKRTILLNYQVLKAMYHARKHHKLSEWRGFCSWIETLPYSELIAE